MKLYPLYEFPPTLAELNKLLEMLDLAQPLSIEHTKKLVHRLYGKRPSRTNIQIKELRKLGLIEGDTDISLSWETQLYMDLGRCLSGLLVHLIYRLPDLFRDCKTICKIDPEFALSNPKLYNMLLNQGYQEEKLATAREKLYAIKRLINACQIQGELNPFVAYMDYIEFLHLMQEVYLGITRGRLQQNVAIKEMQSAAKESGIEEKEFEKHMILLYKDPVFSAKTSFSTVNRDFASTSYFEINEREYYYIKIKEILDIEGK